MKCGRTTAASEKAGLAMATISQRIKVIVGEISCPGCALDIETVLEDIDGVVNAIVNVSQRTIIVEYNPDLIDEHAIIDRIRGLKLKIEKRL